MACRVSAKAESVLPANADPQDKSIAVVQKSPAIGTIVVKVCEAQVVFSPLAQYGLILT
jgi:hypothetical protein